MSLKITVIVRQSHFLFEVFFQFKVFVCNLDRKVKKKSQTRLKTQRNSTQRKMRELLPINIFENQCTTEEENFNAEVGLDSELLL